MPRYTINFEANGTRQTLTVEGDRPPTPEEASQLILQGLGTKEGVAGRRPLTLANGQGQIAVDPGLLPKVFAGSLRPMTTGQKQDTLGTMLGQTGGALLGKAAVPLLTPVLGPYAPLAQGAIEGGAALLGLMGARAVTGREQPTVAEGAMTALPPVAMRGALETVPQVVRGALAQSKAGKFAHQEEIRTARQQLTRDYEQAQQAQHEAMAPIEEANTALQKEFKAAQQVQNRLRKVMQDTQRRLVLAARGERAVNVGRIREAVKDLPAPTEADVSQAYALVDAMDVKLPMATVTAAQKAIQAEEALLQKFPALQSSQIQAIARTAKDAAEQVSPLVDQFGRPMPAAPVPTTLTFQELRAALSRTGQRIASLRGATEPTAREQLRAYTGVRAALHDTLEEAASHSDLPAQAQAALQYANALYKKARSVEDLSSLVERAIRTRPDGVQEFNPAAVLDAFRKSTDGQQLRLRLKESGMFDDLEKTLHVMAEKTKSPPPLTLPRAPMQPGIDIMGRARMQLPDPPRPVLPRMPFDPDIQKGGGLPQAFGTAAIGGAVATGLGASPVAAGATSAALMLPTLLSRALMTPTGQQLVLRLMRARGPVLDEITVGLLNTAMGAELRSGTTVEVPPGLPPGVRPGQERR